RPDVVIESVGGAANTAADAVGVVRRGGRIVILGSYGGPKAIDLMRLMRNESTLIGSFCYGSGERESEFTTAARMTGRWRDELRALTTHQFPLDNVKDAFATADDKSTGAIKVTLTP
ncbi:MAG: zinc-binding dehydrogenase, partial [Acidimicrobiia bacterium]